MAGIDRRRLLARSAQAAGGWVLGANLFQGLVARGALAAPESATSSGYGPLAPKPSENTGETYLALPPGFKYTVLGRTLSPMSDLRPTPPAHDGMAAFPGPGGSIRLVRNHEVPSTGPALGLPAYDPLAQGGTTTLEVDPRTRRLRRAFLSLAGTSTNCAGGPTPWASWLSCEETTAGASRGYTQPHGYVFEVPSGAGGPVDPIPLRAMGRFEHEAVAVDPGGAIVYETEDESRAGFYRFVPNVRGNLAAGGTLEMLAVVDRPQYDTRTGQQVGQPLLARWVTIPDPDPEGAEADPAAVFTQGHAAGGAVFSRLEGAWTGADRVYFHSTDGGEARLGQVWEYVPIDATTGQLTLVFESSSPAVLDHPDNLCVSPRGGLVICEDGNGDQYVRGLTPQGAVFDFARNEVPGFESSEFAGACFSPDGETLFFNIQVPGLTFAVWGPWSRGAL